MLAPRAWLTACRLAQRPNQGRTKAELSSYRTLARLGVLSGRASTRQSVEKSFDKADAVVVQLCRAFGPGRLINDNRKPGAAENSIWLEAGCMGDRRVRGCNEAAGVRGRAAPISGGGCTRCMTAQDAVFVSCRLFGSEVLRCGINEPVEPPANA